MDESSLRAQLGKLEALRTSLHSSFRFWDWIVVIGVALEFVVLGVEYWDEWRAFLRATIDLPERPKTWLFLVGFLGIAMVAGGIAEELKIDSQIEGVETEIRSVNEQLFGIVSEQAEDASAKSKSAGEKADAVDRKIGNAQVKVAALSKVADAIEAQIAWRHLNKKQQDEIAADMQSFSGVHTRVQYTKDDNEAYEFGREITLALTSAHWSLPMGEPEVLTPYNEGNLQILGMLKTPLNGVRLEWNGDQSRAAAAALLTQLTSRGFDTGMRRVAQLAGIKDVLLVVIGRRPEGLQGEAKLAAEREAQRKIKANAK